MDVDDVWHHRRADDADGQQRRVGARQAGDRRVVEDLAPVRPSQHGLDHVADRDQQRAAADEHLQAAIAVALQGENEAHPDPGDQCCTGQGNAREQVDPDRRTEELGQVGGHRRDLLGQPQEVTRPGR